MKISTFFKKIKKNTQKKGFTLLETLVAIFILTLALTGPIYIATLAIRGSVESRDNISAYNLAEEAIEVVRSNRDTQSLAYGPVAMEGVRWTSTLTGTTNCLNALGSITVKCVLTRSNTGVYAFTQCPAQLCPPLSFDPEGIVIYGGTNSTAVNSKFTREVYLQTSPQDGKSDNLPNREVDLVVTVKWKDKGRDRQYQLVERLLNQQYGKYYD